MTLQQMKYLLEVVRCGSISEAAKELFISQPSLSAAVREVEKEMNIEIFPRTPKGMQLTTDGSELLSFVRPVVEQSNLLDQRYKDRGPAKMLCSVSTQHYSFAVEAFVSLIARLDIPEYEFALRETQTAKIIEDVAEFRSEIGLLYLSSFNEKVILKRLREGQLEFIPLFTAKPHVFISVNHPLAAKESVTMDDLEPYPILSFEQGECNSVYYSEELMSQVPHSKHIHVSDRATLFNLVIGLGGYTISSGVLSSDLNGERIISRPLECDEEMWIGYIKHEKSLLGSFATAYIEELKAVILREGLRS